MMGAKPVLLGVMKRVQRHNEERTGSVPTQGTMHCTFIFSDGSQKYSPATIINKKQ
jgi:hypothetical protein